MIRLLIADDHPVVRAGLKGIVAEQPDMRIVAESMELDVKTETGTVYNGTVQVGDRRFLVDRMRIDIKKTPSSLSVDLEPLPSPATRPR